MVSQPSAMCGSYRHCGGMLIEIISERRYSYFPMCPWSMSGTAHTSLQTQWMGDMQETFASPSKNVALQRKEKVKKKKKGNCKALSINTR